MSDFGDLTEPRPPMGPPPPPPPPGFSASAPGGFAGVQPPPPPYAPPGAPSPYGPRSEFGMQQYATMRVPRPPVTVGAVLLLFGGAMVALGSALNWFSIAGESFTGFTRGAGDDVKDGPFFLTFGLVLLGFGIALLSARKILAVTILAIVVAAMTVLFAFADLGSLSDSKKAADAFGIDFSTGPGLYLCVFGGLVALAGAIAATAKRRR